MRAYFLFLIVAAAGACNVNEYNSRLEDPANYNNEVAITVETLVEDSVVEGSMHKVTGKSGYEMFLKLKGLARDTTLVRLSEHPHPKVRVYAMWALAKNNRELGLKEFERLKNDSLWIPYSSGKIQTIMPVAAMIAIHYNLVVLKPRDHSCCQKPKIISSVPKTDNSMFSDITCPKCNYTKTEQLPTEVCQIKYTCTNCKAELLPKSGDCCVFCTYGSHKCPSKQ